MSPPIEIATAPPIPPIRLRPASWDSGHRPWPLPDCPWAATLTLEDLLFLHWPIDPTLLSSTLPDGLEIDTFNGQAWLGVVLFKTQHIRARLIRSLPSVTAYTQLSVRTYVTSGGKPGMYFFSLDASNSLVVRAARAVMGMNFHEAQVQADHDADGWLRYHGARSSKQEPTQRFDVTCRPLGQPALPEIGSLDHFLLERYCLYAVSPDGVIRRGEFHHQPWQTQPAEAHIAQLGSVSELGLGDMNQTPIVRFTPRMDLAAWLPKRALPADPVESRR